MHSIIKALGLITLPLSIGVVLCLRLLKKAPYIFVINNEFYGHLAFDTELRIREANNRTIIAALKLRKSVNSALEEMIRQRLFLAPRFLVLPYVAFFSRLPKSVREWFGVITWEPYREIGRQYLLGNGDSELKLTSNQLQRSEQILKRLNLTKGKYFCISVRDSSYHAGRVGQQNENHRNLDFSIFMPMLQSLSSEYRIVRIGRGDSIQSRIPNLVDYAATQNPDPLADVVLLKHSLGLISTGNGVAAVAAVLRVPCLYISHFPWEILQTYSNRNWIVPAVYQDRCTKAIVHPKHFMSANGIPFANDFYFERNLERRIPSTEEVVMYCREFMLAISGSCAAVQSAVLTENHYQQNKTFWLKYKSALPLWAQPLHKDISAVVPQSFLDNYDLFATN
jgi:putative glycosyltransferase (TIGR04372 family)